VKSINRLEATEIKVDPAVYDTIAGDCELAPGFVLTISREGDKLIGATGQAQD